MWMVCGILSVIFCVIGWIMVSKKNNRACGASAGSLAFVALTLLMEYRQVSDWVNAEDWAALADVVPTMFSVLTSYVIVMLLANAILISLAGKKSNEE